MEALCLELEMRGVKTAYRDVGEARTKLTSGGGRPRLADQMQNLQGGEVVTVPSEG